MNNKGFTLVELLAVISLLTIVMIIGLVSYDGISAKTQEKLYSDLISKIYVAGEKYTSDTGENEVYVKDLVSAGYLAASGSDGILRDSAGNDLSCYYIDTSSEASDVSSPAKGRVWVESTQDVCNANLVFK